MQPRRFERFSKLSALIRAIAHLIHVARTFSHSTQTNSCKGWHICHPTVEERTKAKVCVLKCVQRECYQIKCVGYIPLSSSLWKLHPILDCDGLSRVGGRLTQSGLDWDDINPIIVPGRHHLSVLLIRNFHGTVKHQGRHFTEGVVRAAGFWIVGAKRSIASVLFKCITCKKLRGKTEQQQMVNLPAERLQVAPPFTYVGANVIGPWDVTSRRTRGGHSSSKRWAVMFSCMCTNSSSH